MSGFLTLRVHMQNNVVVFVPYILGVVCYIAIGSETENEERFRPKAIGLIDRYVAPTCMLLITRFFCFIRVVVSIHVH